MYKLRVLVNGKPIHKYHDKEGNIWVEARYGTRYSIEVKNDTWKKALSVISIDGLNVISGKRKDPVKSTGYVISPFNNVIVKGWRINSDQIKEFYFTSPEDSYSNKLGADKQNIGVIGCIVYEEVPKIPYTYTTYSWNNLPVEKSTSGIIDETAIYSSSCQDFSTSISAERSLSKMATGSGNKVGDRSNKVHFGEKVFASAMTIYYDSKENLITRGVIRDLDELPKPFPNGEYCPDL